MVVWRLRATAMLMRTASSEALSQSLHRKVHPASIRTATGSFAFGPSLTRVQQQHVVLRLEGDK